MLTDIQIKLIKPSDKIILYPDGDGLYLRVSKQKMRWQLSVMVEGKRTHFYGGYYPETTLANARKWAVETKKIKCDNPGLANSNLRLKHFADDYREKLVRDGRRQLTLKKFDQLYGKYLSHLEREDIRNIDVKTVHSMLAAIEKKGHYNTSRKVLQLTKGVFLRAKIIGIIEQNPCDGLVQALTSYKELSRASITDVYEFGELLKDIDSSKATIQVRNALKISPLVVTRPTELRLIHEREINFNKAEWTIPAERMKMDQPLIVPLSKQVLKLFEEVAAVSQSPYLFAMKNGKPYSDVTLRKELQNLGYFGAHADKQNIPSDAKFHSPHGFRASFRTITDEVLEWRVDIVEHQLAHMVKDTNGRAYNRTKFLDKRILMMQSWADFCDVLKTGAANDIESKVKEIKGLI